MLYFSPSDTNLPTQEAHHTRHTLDLHPSSTTTSTPSIIQQPHSTFILPTQPCLSSLKKNLAHCSTPSINSTTAMPSHNNHLNRKYLQPFPPSSHASAFNLLRRNRNSRDLLFNACYCCYMFCILSVLLSRSQPNCACQAMHMKFSQCGSFRALRAPSPL